MSEGVPSIQEQAVKQTFCCRRCLLLICISTASFAMAPEQELKRLCGPACVAFCARWLGVEAETMDVAKLAETTDKGTSLRGLETAVTALGLEGKSYDLSLKQLRNVGPATPGIAHVGGDHFVIVWMPTREGDTVMVVDPPRTVEKVSLAAFAQRWTGAILIVSRPGQQPRWPLLPGPWVVACCAALGAAGLTVAWRHRRRGS